jgi:hypothetical protein
VTNQILAKIWATLALIALCQVVQCAQGFIPDCP